MSESGTVDTESAIDVEAQRIAVEEFLRGLLDAFDRSDATVAVTVVEEDTLEAAIDGAELGVLVGQKGVTLQSLQELVRSMVQRRFVGQAHARVRVDVAGYRERRRIALERFTIEIAKGVLDSGVAKALDPMSAADRKVVHDSVNAIDGVETVSEGEDDRPPCGDPRRARDSLHNRSVAARVRHYGAPSSRLAPSHACPLPTSSARRSTPMTIDPTSPTASDDAVLAILRRSQEQHFLGPGPVDRPGRPRAGLRRHGRPAGAGPVPRPRQRRRRAGPGPGGAGVARRVGRAPRRHPEALRVPEGGGRRAGPGGPGAGAPGPGRGCRPGCDPAGGVRRGRGQVVRPAGGDRRVCGAVPASRAAAWWSASRPGPRTRRPTSRWHHVPRAGRRRDFGRSAWWSARPGRRRSTSSRSSRRRPARTSSPAGSASPRSARCSDDVVVHGVLGPVPRGTPPPTSGLLAVRRRATFHVEQPGVWRHVPVRRCSTWNRHAMEPGSPRRRVPRGNDLRGARLTMFHVELATAQVGAAPESAPDVEQRSTWNTSAGTRRVLRNVPRGTHLRGRNGVSPRWRRCSTWNPCRGDADPAGVRRSTWNARGAR